MKKRALAVSIASLLILGAGPALADTALFTPMLSAPTGGSLVCNAKNVGKKTLAELEVALLTIGGGGINACSDLVSAADFANAHTCSESVAGPAAYLCKVRITGDSHRSVRAVLNVLDSSGATILSVPATK